MVSSERCHYSPRIGSKMFFTTLTSRSAGHSGKRRCKVSSCFSSSPYCSSRHKNNCYDVRTKRHFCKTQNPTNLYRVTWIVIVTPITKNLFLFLVSKRTALQSHLRPRGQFETACGDFGGHGGPAHLFVSSIRPTPRHSQFLGASVSLPTLLLPAAW